MDKKIRSDSKQNRESGRVKLTLTGQYRFPNGQWVTCQLIDLSIGGISLEGRFSFYPGDKIEVKFLLDEQRPIVADLVISNISGRKAGGSFENLSEGDLTFIRDYLHKTFFSGKTTIP